MSTMDGNGEFDQNMSVDEMLSIIEKYRSKMMTFDLTADLKKDVCGMCVRPMPSVREANESEENPDACDAWLAKHNDMEMIVDRQTGYINMYRLCDENTFKQWLTTVKSLFGDICHVYKSKPFYVVTSNNRENESGVYVHSSMMGQLLSFVTARRQREESDNSDERSEEEISLRQALLNSLNECDDTDILNIDNHVPQDLSPLQGDGK